MSHTKVGPKDFLTHSQSIKASGIGSRDKIPPGPRPTSLSTESTHTTAAVLNHRLGGDIMNSLLRDHVRD